MSAIYLPRAQSPKQKELESILHNKALFSTLSSSRVDGRVSLEACRFAIDMVGAQAITPEDLQRFVEGGGAETPVPQTEAEFRSEEYTTLTQHTSDQYAELLVTRVDGEKYSKPIKGNIRSIGLVRKLRETRVLYGFSRVYPPTNDAQSLWLGHAREWLPALVVRGEGIFLDFDTQQLDTWAKQSGVVNRVERLVASVARAAVLRNREAEALSAKFVMLHTVAHLLIRQLAYECGYGSASLRERIYCDRRPGEPVMNGILIYTASGDSEGTLGGLVRQGVVGRLEDVLYRALVGALWCSSDPVCIESLSQGTDGVNLAACHGCVLTAETSCEHGNRYLDRGLVVGELEDRGIGYFGSVANLSGL